MCIQTHRLATKQGQRLDYDDKFARNFQRIACAGRTIVFHFLENFRQHMLKKRKQNSIVWRTEQISLEHRTIIKK